MSVNSLPAVALTQQQNLPSESGPPDLLWTGRGVGLQRAGVSETAPRAGYPGPDPQV